jgi:hypothetical protein
MTSPDDAPTPAAFLLHDFGGEHALYSYAPEPSGEARQGDRIHAGLYGIATRSPVTPYICVWRDPDKPFESGRPDTIFLACAFGTAPWRPPGNLVEEVTARQLRDEGAVKMSWQWMGDRYRLARFEFEINPLGSEGAFRSVNLGDQVAELDLAEGEMRFPADRTESFGFHLSGQIKQRRNKGLPMQQPTVRISLSGVAPPIPPWIMY